MPPITLTQSSDHSQTLQGERFAIDVIHRPQENVRSGLQVIIDDDAQGDGTRVRLHVYGRAAWNELKAIVDRAHELIEKEADL